jgi:peptidyl-prolyl cis-trans isomerase SurA
MVNKMFKLNNYRVKLSIGIIVWLFYGFISGFTADKIVARVDKDNILQSDFHKEWNSIDRSDITTSTTANIPEEKMKVLNLLVDRRLLFNQIKKENIKVDPKLLDQEIAAEKISYKSNTDFEAALREKNYTLKEYRDYLEGTMQMQQLLIKHVYAQITVTNAEVEQYYAIHSTRYYTPEQVKLRSIFFKVSTTATAEEKGQKLATAKLVLLKIKLGSRFEDMAKEKSDSPNAIRGGDDGYVTREMLQRTPEIANAVFGLSVGEVSEVIETKYGFYILKVEGLITGRGKRFWEVRDQIQKDINRERATEQYNRFLEDLRKQYQIELFPENLP